MSSSDAWAEIQALKSKRDERRKRLEERKKEREDILKSGLDNVVGISSVPSSSNVPTTQKSPDFGDISNVGNNPVQSSNTTSPVLSPTERHETIVSRNTDATWDKENEEILFENGVLQSLHDLALHLPTDSKHLQSIVNKLLGKTFHHDKFTNLLQKFAVQELISIEERTSLDGVYLEVGAVEDAKVLDMITTSLEISSPLNRKRKGDNFNQLSEENQDIVPPEKKSKENDVLSLLSLASTREKENKRLGEEILELLGRPTVKETLLSEQFRSVGGNTVQEFCPHGTKTECRRVSGNPCGRLHFRKIIQSHTEESLGDCSFLNTCFHMETCKYVHYEVDSEKPETTKEPETDSPNEEEVGIGRERKVFATALHPAQWIHCDLRFFDMSILGKFSVVMADPPWDIHMELPYGTLSDDEMRQLNIPALQDEGLIFLWVTGRAMELGRECLQLWGYERVDELIWVKSNQLQRIIRTGRTGHWLNHGKEHCLVGMKGSPPINAGLDCDVIVAEVRATSHKPDEIYGIIERLSPGTRKIELFGRPHNIQPNWTTLGNQLAGIHLEDEDLRERFYGRYPDGNINSATPILPKS